MQRVRARVLPVIGVAVALVALSGCDESPTTAAHVGSQTISTDDVGLMAKALCEEQVAAKGSAQAPPAQPMSAVNSSALGALIQSAVDKQYAASKHLDYDKVSMAQQLEQLEPLIAKLPADDRKRTRELITQLFKGQLQIFQEVVAKLQATGVQPTQALVQQGAQATEDAYAKKLHVDVNPRYDAPTIGKSGDGSRSLSKAVSAGAKDAQATSPDASWVTGLPAAQRCG